MPELVIQRLHGAAIAAVVDQLAALRICVFRDFPYLYEGDEAYERRYLQTYLNSPRSLCLLVKDGDAVVGASTALPLADESREFQQPFVAAGMDLERIFYFGESVVLPAYRGRGLGVRFFAEREAHARALGGFDWCCFCAVERPADHPLRPAGYQPLDRFWQQRGFAHQPQLRTHYEWQDVGDNHPSAKAMSFWLKEIR